MKSYRVEIRVMDRDVWESHSENMEVPEGMMDHMDWEHLVFLVLNELKAIIAEKQAGEAGAEDGN
jgi:hypothetical protein